MTRKFRFFNAGALEQLLIENENDLATVETLDPKLWVATSMPTTGVEFDERTLALIDSDGDGRIRLPEIKKAVAFLRENLTDFASFFASSDTIPLSALAAGTPARAAAESALSLAGNAVSQNEISLAQAEDAFKNFSSRAFNGDGILTPEAAPDAALASVISDIALATGGTADSSGKLGIVPGQIGEFLESAAAVLAWRENSVSEAEKIFPFGEDATADAWGAIDAVRAKVEDFFARVRLASYDPACTEKLNPTEAEIGALAVGEITGAASKDFPLARVAAAADGVPALPLSSGVNPAWSDALATLRDSVLFPEIFLFEDRDEMTETQWRELLAKFSAYEKWLAAKPAGNICAISPERIKEIVAARPAETLAPLFERDKAEGPLRAGLVSLERVCRYSRDLLRLLRNFVSFADFYALSENTIFLVGKLYLDRRACSLCVRVADIGAHSALAANSNCCIVYCNCTRRSDGKTMSIAAVFGDGDSDYLRVGRNGVFFDKKGDDWDATIAKIIEQPISIRQAFWSPYKKLARFVETQITNFASAREKKVESGMSAGVDSAAVATTSGDPAGTPAKPAFDVAKFAGIFAAIGLALGAIGGALAALGGSFMALEWWQMPLAVAGVILLISCPSMILAAMKLRGRTLGPILDANSWAINGNVKINISLGKAYTEMPKKPAGSSVCGVDPFPTKTFPWGKTLAVLAVLAALAFASVKFCPFVREKLDLDTAEKDVPAQQIPPAQETPADSATSAQ